MILNGLRREFSLSEETRVNVSQEYLVPMSEVNVEPKCEEMHYCNFGLWSLDYRANG